MSPTAIPLDRRLRVIEIYASIQGESAWAGLPCTFVRLAGCNLRCTWCDSVYTFTGGERHSIDQVLDRVDALGIGLVELTGGEPLAHRQAPTLLQELIDRGHQVLLETSGSLDISGVPDPVHVIMDLKAPDSGEEHANLWSNLPLLRAKDNLKIVLASRRDYEWAREIVRRHDFARQVPVYFSPVWGQLSPAELAAWLTQDVLEVRLQLQLHKILWPAETRGV